MPELPEVETIKNDLKKRILFDNISKVKVLDPWNLKEISSSDFKAKLEGTKIIDIIRIGKMIIINLDNNFSLLVHLKMTGKFLFFQNNEDINKHTKIFFELKNSEPLLFSDVRKFGVVYLKKTEEIYKINYLKSIGIDPLKKEFTFSVFAALFKNKKIVSIKTFLLDQRLVTGIGNIYASEILFESKINPQRLAKSLSKLELKNLYFAIIKILKKAVNSRGTSVDDYRDANGKKGNFQNILKVYQKAKYFCSNCNKKITRIVQNGRSTFFCDKCQK